MGWIKLDRKICENWLWQDKPFTKGQAWIDLLLLADYEDNDGYYRNSVKHFKAGTVYRSILYLSKRWCWSRNKVKRFLNVLQNKGMITYNATTNDTTITLVKWELYQHSVTTDVTADVTTDITTNVTTNVTTDVTHTRNKEYKEDKEIKEEVSSDEENLDDEPCINYKLLEQWEKDNGKKWEGWIDWSD